MTLSITLIIIVITCIVSFICFNNHQLREQLMFIPYLIKKDGHYHRFISSGFIHGDFFHLFVNMFVLYSFGSNIERIFNALFGSMGNLYYIALYILGIIVASIPSYLKHQNHSHYRALGASGAVSAVLYASILVFPLSTITIFPIPIPMPAIVFGLLYLAYEFYSARTQRNDGIGHDAHFWGAVFGLVFPLILKPSLGPRFVEQITSWSTLPLLQ